MSFPKTVTVTVPGHRKESIFLLRVVEAAIKAYRADDHQIATESQRVNGEIVLENRSEDSESAKLLGPD